MGCNCGGGNRYTNRGTFAARGTSVATPQEWVVTYPTGETQVFDSDTEAYAKLRLRGGGIRQRDKGAA